MSIPSFLKSDITRYLQFGEFLRQPIANEFVQEYRTFLGFSNAYEDRYETLEGVREQVDEVNEELEEVKEERDTLENKNKELEEKIKEIKKNNINECLEIDRLLMTIKMLKPSYVKTYKSESAEALSPDEIEEIVKRVQRTEIESELHEINENIQTYSQNKSMMESLNDELNKLLKRCPYSDLQYKIKTVLKEKFDVKLK
ncbi:MAG: hypothetical protein LBC02_01080 [Planctomycetaceae bacterium]|jgi:chromosome segregation ATPase|nr:hypothetical protein [Planctomycetaceae bacterium]